MSDINDEHIDALVNHLDDGYWPEKHAALTALVAERDALRKRVAYLEALSKPVYIPHGQRVESIDLRERLIESALRGVGCATMAMQPGAELLGRQAVWVVDGALAEMRKGVTRE